MTNPEPTNPNTDPDWAVLASLVGDVACFASVHWGRLPMHRATGCSFEHLLSVGRIEELLATAARRPTFRLVRDGVTLPDARSTRPLRLGGKLIDDVADLGVIASALHEGATLVMQSLQRTVGDIATFCRSLERATSHPVQANAYLTPPGASGLAAHTDDHDVFVLQISGHKDWSIEGLGDLRLKAGDVLYLPSGTRHAATAPDMASLHLTIGVLSVTYGAVLHRTVDALAVAELRRPLPLGYARPGAAGLEDGLRTAIREVAAVLSNADTGAVVDREVAVAQHRRRPIGLGLLQSVLELDALRLTDMVRLRPDAAAWITMSAKTGHVGLRLVDRQMTLPAAMRPALEHLLAGDPVVVADLPGLDEGSQLVLARRLLREVILEQIVPGRS